MVAEFFVEQRVAEGWVLVEDGVWPRYLVAHCRHCGGRLDAGVDLPVRPLRPQHFPLDWDDEHGIGDYGNVLCPDGVTRAEADWTPVPRRVPWLPATPPGRLFRSLAGAPPAVAAVRGLPVDLGAEVRAAVARAGDVAASYLTVRDLLGHDWRQPLDGGVAAWTAVGGHFVITMLRMAQRSAGDLDAVRCVFWMRPGGADRGT